MNMVGKPLVSIITACYNEEKYIEEMLLSILNQTYCNIEMICVDDGSEDNTADIIKSYIDIFEKNNRRLYYFYQKNQGQAVATNNALKIIHGKYLAWIDGDDYLFPGAIEKKVEFLENNDEYGMVTSDFYLLFQDKAAPMERKSLKYGDLNFQTNQFYLTLAGLSIIENLAHMIRVDYFRKINPSMEIPICREGQNFQIVLPMQYRYKRGYIDEPLGCYRIHDDSHFHKKRTFDEWVNRNNSLLNMVKEVFDLLEINQNEQERLLRISSFYRGMRVIDNG